MFVDAPASVAILTAEAEADTLADPLDAAPSPMSWPIAVYRRLDMRHRHHCSA